MPKLCQCKKQFIRDLILETLNTGSFSAYMNNSEKVDEIQYSTGKVEDIERVLESDCVCSKEERPNIIRVYLGKQEVGKVHLTDGFCIFGKEYRVEYEYNHAVTVMESWDEHMKNKEKKSQSHCEHEKSKESNSPPSKTEHNRFLVEDQLGYFSKEEKKECEHLYIQELILFGDLISAKKEQFSNCQVTLWLCHKCGLVTCLNPNQE